jgi:hypothetical protein
MRQIFGRTLDCLRRRSSASTAEIVRGKFRVTITTSLDDSFFQNISGRHDLNHGRACKTMDGHDSPPEQSRANGDNDGADSALRTNKRRRIAIACSACRTRKSRVRHDLTSSKGNCWLTSKASVRWCTPEVWLVYRARIRLCLCAIILVKQCDSWQGVSPPTCVPGKISSLHVSF